MNLPGGRRGRLDELESHEPHAGVNVRRIDGPAMTVTFYEFGPGATFPLHSHPQAQLTLVEEGELLFRVDGGEHRLGVGEWIVAAPGEAHEAQAGPAGATVVSILAPRRGDADISFH